MLKQLINEKVGSLDSLSTEEKSTVVAAINEVYQGFETLGNSIIGIRNGLTDVNNEVGNQGETIRQNTELLGKAFLSKPRFTGNIDELLAESDVGMYWCAIPEGASGTFPDEMINYFFLNVYRADSVVRQTMLSFDSYSVYERLYVNDAWMHWIKISKIGDISNPNLLFNPNFKTNQRGQSEYRGSNIYTVDRWMIWNATLFPLENGINVVINDSGYYELKQFIEIDVKNFEGKSITGSICVDGVVYSLTYYLPTTINVQVETTKNLFENFHLRLGINPFTKMLYFWVFNEGAGSYVINWAKLELGENPTSFVPPNPMVELIKCQSYYKKIDYGILGYTLVKTYMIISTNIARNMRVAPTVRFIKDTTQGGNDLIIIPLSSQEGTVGIWYLESVTLNPAGCIILKDTGIDFASQTALYASFDSDNFLELDAEIY